MWGRRISQVGDGSRACQAYKRQGDVTAVSAVGTGTLGEAWDDLVPLGRRTNGYQCPTACPSMFRPGVLMCTGLWIDGPTTPSCLSPPPHAHTTALCPTLSLLLETWVVL